MNSNAFNKLSNCPSQALLQTFQKLKRNQNSNKSNSNQKSLK